MSTDIFDRHFATGFDTGWHRDIPHFTPEDWREYIKLTHTLWHLELTRGDCMQSQYTEVYFAIPESFREAFGHTDSRQVVMAALRAMTSPLGPLVFEGHLYVTDGLHQIFDNVFEGNRWPPETRGQFLHGLNLAAADQTINRFVTASLANLKLRLFGISDQLNRPAERNILAVAPTPRP